MIKISWIKSSRTCLIIWRILIKITINRNFKKIERNRNGLNWASTLNCSGKLKKNFDDIAWKARKNDWGLKIEKNERVGSYVKRKINGR